MDGNLGLKSSVLSPVSRKIFDQFSTLQQIQSHHKRIGGSKAVVDTTPPKSLNKSVVRKDQIERSAQHSSKSSSRTNSRLSSASVSKSLQIIPNSQLNCKKPRVSEQQQSSSRPSSVANKISWYLEAIQQSAVPLMPWNRLQEMALVYNSPYAGNFSKEPYKNGILKRHEGCFVRPARTLFPRSLAQSRIESKVKKMEHCYNAPSLQKKQSRKKAATQETEDLEKLLHEHLRQLEHQETCYEKWLQDQAQRAEARKEVLLTSRAGPSSSGPSRFRQSSTIKHLDRQLRSSDSGRETDRSSQKGHTRMGDEEKQLQFVSSITEDILRSGLFSDSAIKQTVRFHLDEKSQDLEDEKVQFLVDQLLSDLCITADRTNSHSLEFVR